MPTLVCSVSFSDSDVTAAAQAVRRLVSFVHDMETAGTYASASEVVVEKQKRQRERGARERESKQQS